MTDERGAAGEAPAASRHRCNSRRRPPTLRTVPLRAPLALLVLATAGRGVAPAAAGGQLALDRVAAACPEDAGPPLDATAALPAHRP